MKVLDNGYLEIKEVWGSDQSIIEAARMSTDKGFLGWGTPEKPGDEKLLKYLWNNQHSSPFEMAGLRIEVQAPIMVFREWHRHRTQSYSELSARYTVMPDSHYLPTLERLKLNSLTNKQAQGINSLAQDNELNKWLDQAQDIQTLIYAHYTQGLEIGIPKEIARMNTPVSRYSRMQASANLLNWLKFLKLRVAENAQWEIRQYALALKDTMVQYFPRTMEIVNL